MVNILLIYGYIYGYIYSTIFGLNSTIFMTTSQEIILFKPHYLLLVGGFNPSEKYEFVSWDCSSQYMETQKNVPNHQPVYMYIYTYIPYGYLR